MAQKEGTAFIDSLKQRLKAVTDDTERVNLLDDLSFAYYSENPDEGIKYGLQCLTLAEKIGWKKGIGRANRCLGINYENKGVYPKALEYFFKSLQVSEEMGDSLSIAKSISTIGVIYDDQKDYKKALEYYSAGLNIFKRLGDKANIAINLGNIGIVYRGLRNLPKALEYDSLALHAYEEISDKSGIARSVGNIGIHLLGANCYELSLDYSIRALKMYEESDNKYGQALTYGNIGEAYFTAALDSLRDTQKKGPFTGDNKTNLHKAEEYLAKSIAIAKAAGYLNVVCDNGNTLARAQEMLGDYQLALINYKYYTELRDSVFNDESKVNIQNLISQRELDIKDKEIMINKLAIAKKRNERISYIIGIGLLLVVLIVIARNYRTQKKLNNTITKLVNEQEKTIEQRTAALVSANQKLLDLIQYNAHNVREPLARVIGAMQIRDHISDEEFFTEVWPMMERSVDDLDNTLKNVISQADDEVGKV